MGTMGHYAGEMGKRQLQSQAYMTQKIRGGSGRATPSLRNYIKQRARLHTVLYYIGLFRKNFTRNVPQRPT